MGEKNILTDAFEANRARLSGVARRMLGSRAEAEDAVQEAWLRLSRSDADAIDNLSGWLTTTLARICLDMLRSRKSRREDAPAAGHDIVDVADEMAARPEQEALLADSVGVALQVVLDRLSPAERVAFVLHDMFDLSFEEIAPIVQRTPEAARQLASRARRRVQAPSGEIETDRAQRRAIVEAFLTAARGGDLAGLLAVLDPDVVVRADAAIVALNRGAPAELRGAETVARSYLGKAGAARPALLDGEVGALVAPAGKLLLVLKVSIAGGRITAIEAIGDPARLARTDIEAF